MWKKQAVSASTNVHDQYSLPRAVHWSQTSLINVFIYVVFLIISPISKTDAYLLLKVLVCFTLKWLTLKWGYGISDYMCTVIN